MTTINLAQPGPVDPAFDVWVWVALGVLLAVLGARAVLVENGRARLGRAPAKVGSLTLASVVAAVALTVLLAMQGGHLLVHSLLTGTDPREAGAPARANPPAAGNPPAPAPGAPVPGAPAPGGPAEPAGQPPAGVPAAPGG